MMGLYSSRNQTTTRDIRPKFKRIPDRFETIEEVKKALREEGLEACQLMVGVDFTKSNTWTGETSFGGRCLHSIEGPPNPYLVALSLITRTLQDFDDDNLIPCYGFGDNFTRGDSVFSFYPGDSPAKGLDSLLLRYRQIAPLVDLSGPTSFAPLIRQAMRHVYNNQMQFHVLLILADGQISSGCMQETMDAIVKATHFPLSIIMIGVGDGPWQAMQYFDDSLPTREWDNFQFVEFNKIMNNPSLLNEQRKEASFALNALMELPDQYKIAQNMVGSREQADKVRNIVASIPPSVLIDPPLYFDSRSEQEGQRER